VRALVSRSAPSSLARRDNICWGEDYDVARFDEVVECCALRDDFATLPNGDMTEVGENGVTLSGGQKARISLARAVYQVCHVTVRFSALKAASQ